MNYYLIIIFFVSTIFLIPMLNSVYGFGVLQIGSFSEFNGYGFVQIKDKILPQYDGTAPQSIIKVKAETDSAPDETAGDGTNSITSAKTISPSVGVKILSPTSGKEIPVGNLTIFGVSTDNEKSDCTVLVDWNNEKPFQKAKAAGPYGDNDYSSWTFTYSPSYHAIENGLNDLTSKLECLENSKVTTKWHSINVTGVVTKEAIPITTTVLHDPLGILPQLRTLSTSPSAITQNISSNESTLANNNLLTHVELSKKLMFPGEAQNFTVKISDPVTSENIAGANVDVKIMQGNMTVNEYNGSSDNLGEYSQSWNIMPSTPSGIYDVVVSTSADGYQPTSLTGSFEVQRQLLLEASLLKRLVVPGDQQTVDVKVIDANTKEIVPGAYIIAKIGQKADNGTSDGVGAYSHTWNITSDIPTGKYKVLVSASADGYQPASLTGSFEVQRQLLVEAALSNDLVIPGDEQTIEVKVVDANTNEIVTGANVVGKIGAKKFTASTDDNGLASYQWDTPSTSGGNNYNVVLDVTADGYPKVTKTTSFKMDKPQNLLEPPISNYEGSMIKVKHNELNNNQERSQNKIQECVNMLSALDCSGMVSDKPVQSPATDDKPVQSPATDDKSNNNSEIDYNPLLNSNIMENITPEGNQEDDIGYDFLGSVTN